jgi:hypothetical protein
LAVALLDIVVLAVGVGLTYVHAIGEGGTAVAIPAIGIFTFAGFYYATTDVRTAIAATFVILYVVILTTLLLDSNLRDVVQSNDFAKSLVSQFTTLVGTVVAFYLGAAAIVRRTELQEETKKLRQAPAVHVPPPDAVPPGSVDDRETAA